MEVTQFPFFPSFKGEHHQWWGQFTLCYTLVSVCCSPYATLDIKHRGKLWFLPLRQSACSPSFGAFSLFHVFTKRFTFANFVYKSA